MFHVDVLLRLNITFSNIFFSYVYWRSDSNCLKQHIGIITKNPVYHFKYCGILPSFQSFPDSDTVNIEVNSSPITVTKTDIIYTILDSGILKSNEVSTNLSDPEYVLKCRFYVMGLASVLFYYYIKTSHILYITAQTPHLHSVEVFDGPGRWSKSLNYSATNDKGFIFFSSTFQMTIFISVLEHTLLHSNVVFHYDSRRQRKNIGNFFVSTEGQPIKMSQLQTCQERKFCILRLQTSSFEQLSLTTKKFVYKGESDNQQCLYAGVALYDEEGETPKHIATECSYLMHVTKSNVTCFHERRGTHHHHPVSALYFKYYPPVWHFEPHMNPTKSVHTNTTKILLVFYSYQEYGSLKVEMSAQGRNCRVLQFDHCSIFRYILLPWNQTCSVLQFVHKEGVSCYNTYRWSLSPASTSEVGKAMVIDGRGTFRGWCVFKQLDFHAQK